MAKADVAIIIVAWNSSAMLGDVLEALRSQTRKPERILVVENGSEDAELTASRVAQFGEAEILALPKNLGFAAANNLAISNCDSEFVVLLNPDAAPEPEWLENLHLAASGFPDMVAFGSRQLIHSNPDYLDGKGDSYHMSGLVWRDGYGVRQKAADLIQQEIFSPCAAAALYRRQAVLDVGGFDEDFFCYVEDVDLGFRLRLAGHKAMYVPDAIVHHLGSATTGGQHSEFAVYHGHRNLVWTYIKNMPEVLFWILLPLHALMNLSAIVLFTFRGQTKIILKAKWDAIKGIPRAWRKRREIQAKRVATIGDIWRVLDKSLLPLLSDKTNIQTEQHT